MARDDQRVMNKAETGVSAARSPECETREMSEGSGAFMGFSLQEKNSRADWRGGKALSRPDFQNSLAPAPTPKRVGPKLPFAAVSCQLKPLQWLPVLLTDAAFSTSSAVTALF